LFPRRSIAGWAIPGGLALVLLAAVGCGNGTEEVPPGGSPVPDPALDHSERPWQVVVSLPILADFAREMGGTQVEVTALIPPGTDPHTYVPREEDAALIEGADLILVNGLGIDQPTIDFIESHRPDGRLFLIDIARNVPSPSHPLPLGGMPVYAKEAGDNPHLFLDPQLAVTYAETASHSLVILDDENEPYYDALFANYRMRLDELDKAIAADMGSIPEANRVLVASHDSMIHWANRYGLTVPTNPLGVGDERSADVVPAVFSEVGMDNSEITSHAEKAGRDLCELETDSIKDADTSYLDMMRRNSEEIADCLGA
jgi:zinc/manganese transport system substrate-binding protein/manganese/iron transport system substrate-binding protein